MEPRILIGQASAEAPGCASVPSSLMHDAASAIDAEAACDRLRAHGANYTHAVGLPDPCRMRIQLDDMKDTRREHCEARSS